MRIGEVKLQDNAVTRTLRERIGYLQLAAVAELPKLIYPQPPLTAKLHSVGQQVILILCPIKLHENCIVMSDTSGQIVCYVDAACKTKLNNFYLISHFEVFCAKDNTFALIFTARNLIDLDSPASQCVVCRRPCVQGLLKCNLHLQYEFAQFNYALAYQQARFAQYFSFVDLSDGLSQEYTDFLKAESQRQERKTAVFERKAVPLPARTFVNRQIVVFYCKDCDKVYFYKWARCVRQSHHVYARAIWKFEACCKKCGYSVVTVRNDERCIVCGAALENLIPQDMVYNR